MFNNLPPAAGYFITGTDTGVGKTYMTCRLLDALHTQGKTALGFKPMASGAEATPEGLRNEDGLLLQAHSSGEPEYTHINPICLEPAIAPHIAAAQAGETLSVTRSLADLATLQHTYQPNVVVVEGAGGWLCPLDEQHTFADLALAIGFPVILVVGMQLGCLNHALLTAQAIKASGLPFAGWIANTPSGTAMPCYQDNLATLARHLGPALAYSR